MLQSFNLSRKKLLDFIHTKLTHFERDLKLVGEFGKLSSQVTEAKSLLKEIQKVSEGDGKKVKAFKAKILNLLELAEKNIFVHLNLKIWISSLAFILL